MKKKTALFIALCCICFIFILENPQKFSNLISNVNEAFKTASKEDNTEEEDTADTLDNNTIDLSQNTGDKAARESTEDTESSYITDTQNPKSEEAIKTFHTLSLSKETLRSLPAGTILYGNAADMIKENCFYYEAIKDDIKDRIYGKSYKEDCTVPYEDLRYVRVLYYGFDKETHIGELIVNKAIASDLVDIFSELYALQYPIESMVLVDNYNADDNASMAANNTSAFNYRSVPGSARLSNHALGLAIDINPLYNPYVKADKKGTTVLPEEGSLYADRTLACPYYITKEDLCYQVFTKYGFTWGGSWNSLKDYQHFEKEIK